MFFVPTWVTNIIFLGTFYLSIFQHVKLKRPDPVRNLQFVMMVFSLAMMLVVTLYNRQNAWLSMGFLATSLVCLAVTYRQFRKLPPTRSFL